MKPISIKLVIHLGAVIIECNTSSILRAKVLNNNMELKSRNIKTPTVYIARRLRELCDNFEEEFSGASASIVGKGYNSEEDTGFRFILNVFSTHAVTKCYETRTAWAAANYGNSGSLLRMVLPPPNVTGKLHLGHALTVIIEDTFCRHHRIKGGVVSIATQTVVEKYLWKEKSLRRDMLSNEQFIDSCKQWSEMNSSAIRKQLDILGATLDWQNVYYTLDKKFSSAVIQAFVTLHKDGFIYRDNKVVNWCPHLQSSLSDQEVDHVSVSEPTKISVPFSQGGRRVVEVGAMYSIKYPIDNSDRFIEVGTTRPETIFGDVALAVHPNDDRYSKLIGELVCHPLLLGRKIPIIADNRVQRDKGTGVLKITPCHDKLDYDIASLHWDEILYQDSTAKSRSCIDANGKLNREAGEFVGLDRFDGRIKVIQKLDSLGLFSGRLKHEGQIALCSRTGVFLFVLRLLKIDCDIIEPRLAEQWFMKTAGLYDDAWQAIKAGKIKILPEPQEQKLFDWFSNREPWCLSRQLLWGHRIPAYRSENSPWLIVNSIDVARKHFGENAAIVQDDDVLDTWFSSSLIPLVIAGWPGPEFNPEVPFLNVMETGWDILGFWVARMIIMTMKLSNGHMPFSHVVLHGLIRDSSGKKMSKSLGNVIDPLDIVHGISQEEMVQRIRDSSLSEDDMASAISAVSARFPNGITRVGPDALRFALLRHNLFASDILLNIVDFSTEGSRFCNKVWNMVAYFESINEKFYNMKDVDSDHPADEWIVSRLAGTLSEVDRYMTNHTPHLAFNTLYNFILHSLCDVYIETTKRAVWESNFDRMAQICTTLNRVVQPTLVQLSVFMPFISEYLYERAFRRERGSIYFDFVKVSYFAPYRNTKLEFEMDIFLRIVTVIRSMRRQFQLPSSMVFNGMLHSDCISNEFNRFSPMLFDLVKFNLLDITPLVHQVRAGFVLCPLPGQNARLSLKIQDSERVNFVSHLKQLLHKLEDRRQQFIRKAEKYEDILCKSRQEGNVKPHVMEKYEKKARQARGVANGVSEEVKKLWNLLEDMNL
ncbi:valine--tRNA ligase [Dictyocaulus viviparus]|uniref:valine--tRNA ligase n=1 Tax=Dictyocaulus viviparus TaxID=29172 RepID=A0A0D8YCF6_DICVI|nr:valine--tRNA ligase [Dictyocaulus viviparus]